MKNYTTFAETEALLKIAIELPGSSIKEISAGTDIKPNTLYKWKSNGKVHLSPQKADRLLLYLIQQEPARLERAERLNEEALYNHHIITASVPSSLSRGSDMEA